MQAGGVVGRNTRAGGPFTAACKRRSATGPARSRRAAISAGFHVHCIGHDSRVR